MATRATLPVLAVFFCACSSVVRQIADLDIQIPGLENAIVVIDLCERDSVGAISCYPERLHSYNTTKRGLIRACNEFKNYPDGPRTARFILEVSKDGYKSWAPVLDCDKEGLSALDRP